MYDTSPQGMHTATTVALPPTVTAHDIWRILRRRFGLFLFTLVIVVATSLYLTSKMPRVYQAEARVLVDTQTDTAVPASVLDLLHGGGNRPIMLEIEKIKARSFLEMLAARINQPGVDAAMLKNVLTVSGNTDGAILSIGAKVGDPALAKKIADTTAKLYMEQVGVEYDEKANQSQSRLKSAQQKAQVEKEQAEKALNAFNARMGNSNPSIYFNERANDTVLVGKALEDALRGLPLQEKQMTNLQEQQAKVPQWVQGGYNAEKNPAINQNILEIQALESKRKDLLQNFTEDSLEVQEVDDQIRVKEEAIQKVSHDLPWLNGSKGFGRNPDYANLTTQIQNTKLSIRQTRQGIESLGKRLAQLREEQRKLAPLQSEYEGLKRKRDGATDAFWKAGVGLINMESTKVVSAPMLKLLESAQLPDTPVSPKPLLNAIMAVVLGLLCGGGMAVLAEYLSGGAAFAPEREPDPAAYLPRVAGVPLLGTMSVALPGLTEASGLPAPISAHSRAEDVLREVGFTLAHRGAREPVPVVLFTGTRSDEMSAAVASHLAAMLVRDGLRVTLVDADRTQPRLNQVFGKPDSPGLSDVLAGRVRARDILHIGKGGELRFLAAGSPDDQTPLTESGLRKVFADLASPRDTDIVIVSGPSVWQAPLVSPLERAAKGMVLVAAPGRAGTSGPAESVARARRLLSNGYKPRILGVVVGSDEGDDALARVISVPTNAQEEIS